MNPRRAVLYLVLCGVGVTMAWPFFWMVTTSLKPPPDVFASPPKWVPHPVTLDAYRHVFTDQPFGRYLSNSLIVTVVVVATNVLFGTAAAYAFAKLRFPGRNVIFFALLLTLMVPFQVNLIPLYRMMVTLHEWSPLLGVDTYTGLIAPNAIQVFGVFLMRQYLQTIPDALLESARLDGASELRILRSIVFPMARPAMAALAIFTFLNAWNDFLWPMIVTSSQDMRTLPVGLALLARKNNVSWPDTMAGAVITIAPMIAVFAVLQRRFVEGLTAGAVKDG
ncbi:carbohydrate ABC transporter permease [Actinomadura chibensis]|uniref:Carbohydrate ABC transporter permease n=1 Tax=Actinomadura chibensis TaxID=392828 RepID=A0A5D0N9Q2_9ACTN|nr:carbohydrate ABC transporter permease [Actinomadura chibensis]TYB41082.1 carbohydrate ABC transporter permease [Actinomadura chibensis]